MRAKPLAALLVLCSGACESSGPGLADNGAPPALSGSLLSYDPAAAAANRAQLPAGFTAPDDTVCAADVTRGFLAELATHGLGDTQVKYEWAPVVPGSIPDRPTVQQREFYLSGTVARFERSNTDVLFAHPFGFDTTMDVTLDAPFVSLIDNRPGSENDETAIHTEIERGLFPDETFQLTPAAGDRVLMKGAWILDCGHPPYEAELHPPSFVAVARQQDRATLSLAFANPYRVTQLYGPPTLVEDFANDARFVDPDVAPFPAHFLAEVLAAAGGTKSRLEAHTLLEATRFETLTWFVCAPGPRPAGTALRYSYRFVTRTGVTLTPALRGDSGCLQFTATLTAAYRPMVLPRQDATWAWSALSAAASEQAGTTIDVRQKIIDALRGLGVTQDLTALHEDMPPIIDGYAPLAPRSDAAQDAPTKLVTAADDQPFPFYGRARVAWQ